MKCLICSGDYKTFGMHLKKHNISSKEYYDKFIKKEKEGICYCDKNTKFLDIFKGYSKYCSLKCSNNDLSVKLKKINTCKNNFGVEHPGQSSYLKQKRKNTCLKNYGVSNPSKLDIVKEKMKKTCKNKYGVEYSGQIDSVKKEKRKTFLKNYLKNIKYNLKNLFLQIIDDKEYYDCFSDLNILCLKCNTIFKAKYTYIQQGFGKCPNCYPTYFSIAETNIKNFIKNLGLEVINNSRQIIPPYEIDIYIPDKKIAIEYNGLYWHSEKQNKDKNYHLNKLNMCLKNGMTLIQIFEDEWLFKQDIVKSRIKQILGVSNSKRVHARKCIIKLIPNKVKNEFLENYHIQGQDISSIRLGAFSNNELVAVMTFSKGSIAKGANLKPGHWELNRFCTKHTYHIPGIASKLLTFFKRNYKWDQIYSYADRRWSTGNVYKVLGFKEIHYTRPNYWYVKNQQRIHRYNLRKKPDEPKDISEWILRTKEGYTRIWDCGVIKFIIN